jgi:Carboxypeptidase regulatory-like domain
VSFLLRTLLRVVVSTVMLARAGATALEAQGGSFATLSGTVHDASSAVVPSAVVVLTNKGTSVDLRTVSNAAGRYVFPRVSPGDYALSVEKTGFRKATVDVSLTVNDALARDIVVEAGDVSESVTVSGSSGVQIRGAGVSLAVDTRSLETLPLNGRDWTKLTSLAPGAGQTSTAPISGVRGSYNTTTIDGVGSNNERSAEPLAGASAYSGPGLISTEAVQEFRVITSNADATFGRSSGAQINVITKSGTNTLRGSAYEFLRDDALDASDYFNAGPFFDDQGRPVVPPFNQHLFGATAGGPLKRNRHFVFASYEGFRQEREATSSFTFPNRDLIDLMPGDLRAFYRTYYIDRGLVESTTGPGEFRPLTAADRSTATAAGFDPRYFDGDPSNGEAGTLLQSTTSPQNVVHNSVFLRTDSVLGGTWRASGRFNHTKSRQTGPQFTLGSPIDLAIETRTSTTATAEIFGTLTPAQLLEVRVSFTRAEYTTPPDQGVGDPFRAIGVRDDLGILVTPSGTGLNSAGFVGTSSFLDHQNIPQVSALHTWQHGRMTLRSGLDVALFDIDIHNGAGRPTYAFTGFLGPNGLLGASPAQTQAVATSAAASMFGAGGGPTTALRHFTSSRQEYFTQADIRFTSDLTANLGARYTYTAVYREKDDAIANLYAVDESGTIVPDVHPFTFGRSSNRLAPAGNAMYQPDADNWQPRLAVAWDVAGHHTTAIRGSYGAYDDRFFQLVFSAQGGLVNNPPFTRASNAANVPFVLGGELPVVTGTPSVFGVDPNLRNPRVHRVSAGVERQLWTAMSVTADYVGTFARGLFGVADMNGGAGVPQALRPDARFSTVRLIDNTSWSDYHALQVVAQQRYRGGLSFSVAYTLASANDDSSSETFAIFPRLINAGATAGGGFQGGGSNGWVDRSRAADWGRMARVSRHALVASHVVDLPFGPGQRWLSASSRVVRALTSGWTLAGILNVHSGEINWTTLKVQNFDLPPLDQQRRLADILWATDEIIERQLGLENAVSFAVDCVRDEHFANSDRYAATPLRETGSWSSGNTPSRSRGELWNGSFPWVSPKDMKKPLIDDSEEHLSDEGRKEATEAGTGSLLLVIRGMILAHSFPVAITKRRVAFNQDMKALLPSEQFLSKYLYQWFKWATPQILGRISDSSHGTKRLAMDSLFQMTVPKPTATGQSELIERIEALESAREAARRTVEQVKHLQSTFINEVLIHS